MKLFQNSTLSTYVTKCVAGDPNNWVGTESFFYFYFQLLQEEGRGLDQENARTGGNTHKNKTNQ